MIDIRYRLSLPRRLKSIAAICFFMVSLSANMPMARPHPSPKPQPNPQSTWEVEGLSPHVLQLALQAVETATRQGIGNGKVVGVIDFSLPSSKRRLWVLEDRKSVV